MRRPLVFSGEQRKTSQLRSERFRRRTAVTFGPTFDEAVLIGVRKQKC